MLVYFECVTVNLPDLVCYHNSDKIGIMLYEISEFMWKVFTITMFLNSVILRSSNTRNK